MDTIKVLVPHTHGVTMEVDTRLMGLSREALLDTRGYGNMRDGEHPVLGNEALPEGTPHAFIPYTGQHRNIAATPEMAPDREMFYLRTRPQDFPAYVVAVKTNARTRKAEVLDLYDWDCHKCQTAVMTPDLSDVCPNCLL